MVWFTFDVTLAFDATSRTPASGAAALVYAESDTGLTAPLETQDLNGLPIALVASQDGFFPSFRVENVARVRFVSGPFDQVITSGTALAQWAQESATSAAVSSSAAVSTAASVATFQKWVELGITRRNLVVNPRAVGRAFGLAGATGTQSDEVTGGPLGFGYRKLVLTATTTSTPITIAPSATGTAAAAVIAGRTYTFSAYSRMVGGPASTQGGVDVNWYTAAGAAAGNDSAYQGVLVNGTWTRHSKTVVAPATAAFALVTARFSATAGLPVVGAEYGATGFMIEDATTVGTYFDGGMPSSPPAFVVRWSGAENASASEHLDMTPITTAATAIPLGGVTGQALVKASSADRDVTWGTVAGGSGGGTSDHNQLSNLTVGDPHTQYLTAARSDTRHYTKAETDDAITTKVGAASSLDRDRTNHTGAQATTTITGLEPRLVALEAGGGGGGSPVTVDSLSGATTTGRAVMKASSGQAARDAIGAAAASDVAAKADAATLTAALVRRPEIYINPTVTPPNGSLVARHA